MRYVLPLLLLLLLKGCASTKDQGIPEPGSVDWLKRVDAVAKSEGNVIDSEIGSHEWMQVIGRQYGIIDDAGHGPDPGSDEWNHALHYKVFSKQLYAAADKVYLSIDGERLAVFLDDAAATATIFFAGRKAVLPQSIAASGVRFNRDEDEIFWVKGRVATYWRQGQKIFEGVEECR